MISSTIGYRIEQVVEAGADRIAKSGFYLTFVFGGPFREIQASAARQSLNDLAPLNDGFEDTKPLGGDKYPYEITLTRFDSDVKLKTYMGTLQSLGLNFVAVGVKTTVLQLSGVGK